VSFYFLGQSEHLLILIHLTAFKCNYMTCSNYITLISSLVTVINLMWFLLQLYSLIESHVAAYSFYFFSKFVEFGHKALLQCTYYYILLL
jgi:hypothetical protein